MSHVFRRIPHASRQSIHVLKRINYIRCFSVQPRKQVKKKYCRHDVGCAAVCFHVVFTKLLIVFM